MVLYSSPLEKGAGGASFIKNEADGADTMLSRVLVFSLIALSCSAYTPSVPGKRLRERFSTARKESRSIAKRLGSVASDLLLGAPTSSPAPSRATSYKVSSSAADMGGLLKPKQANLTPVQKASVDAWMAQFQRTRDIGVGYYNNVAAAGDARVQAVAGVPPPEVPAPTKVTPSPHTVRAPAPRLDAQRFPGEKASVDAWMAQFQRTREIGVGYYNNAAAAGDARVQARAVMADSAAQQSVRAMPANAARAPARARSPQLDAQRAYAAPQKPTHEFYLQQGLAGAAKKAKQEAELEAFRKSFQKNHFPSH